MAAAGVTGFAAGRGKTRCSPGWRDAVLKPPPRNVPGNPCTVRRFHHVGIVVRNLEEAIGRYRDLFGLASGPVMENPERGVRAAVVNAGGANIELLQPTDEKNPFTAFLAEHGEGIHHICFAVESAGTAHGYLRSKGIELTDAGPRPGFNGYVLFTEPSVTGGVRIELSELFPENRDT